MPEKPVLFVCHGDEKGVMMHPCARAQKALNEAGIEYDKVLAGHGSPIPFLRKGSRDELERETGSTHLPTLKLPDGTVITHSKEIIAWAGEQAAAPV
jgi:glutaredoxin